jgi:hypothetical protein
MLATMEVMPSPPTIQQTAAQQAARDDGMAHLAPTFAFVDDTRIAISDFAKPGQP